MAFLRWISLGALAAVGAVVIAPTHAHACSIDPCADSPEFGLLRVSHETVTTDGVLLLSSQQGNPDGLAPEDAIARMSVTVLGAADLELPGTIEYAAGQYFWRPDVPFLAGTSLSVSVSMETDRNDPVQCGASAGGESTVVVLDETAPDLELPSIEFENNYWFYEDIAFDTAVCCDDGTLTIDSCNTPGFSGTGFCVAPTGTGYAQGSVTLAALPDNLGPTVAVEYLVDGEVVHSNDGLEPLSWGGSRPAAFELQVRITSLLDGSTLEADAFTVDGENPDGLGEQAVDVSAELEANCEGEAYTCEPTEDEFGWDLENCTPYDDDGGTDTDSGGSDSDSDSGSDSGDSDPGGSDSGSGGSDSDTDGGPGQDDGGGGCSVGGGGFGGVAGLLLLALGALRRRR